MKVVKAVKIGLFCADFLQFSPWAFIPVILNV